MIKFTAIKIFGQYSIFIGFVTSIILVFIPLLNQPEALVVNTLDTGTCNYEEEIVGKFGVKVGGLGMFERITGGNYRGTFDVQGVNGEARNVYLFWTLQNATENKTLNVKVNGVNRGTISANQTFGPAKLNTPTTTYWGYIADLGTSGINNGVNTFTIEKNSSGITNFFGVGILIVHKDPSLSSDRHVEIKCGFDGTYANNIGSAPTVTKWGEWSNVVCHQFPKDTSSQRNVNYYAFMSGTKQLSTAYRPNAFWYITGTGTVPNSIFNLNKPPGVPNSGLNGFAQANSFPDLFDATSGNEWDTIDSTKGQPNIIIPSDHTYICFQTQSRNVPPGTQANGLGSSMQWSMSALTFAYSGSASTPTPTLTPSPGPSPTQTVTPFPTPTMTPTPIVFHPWVNTFGGNVYSQKFDQSILDPNIISNTFFESGITTVFDGKPKYLSTYLYLQPESSATPIQSSEKNSALNNYSDSNSEYKTGISWYKYFEQYLKNATLDILETDLTINLISGNKTSEIHPGDISKTAVYFISGDIEFNFKECDSKSIFLIGGNLKIHPNLVNSGFENGCMFIVNNTTTVSPGVSLGSAGVETYYDQLHAYFITGLFATEADPSGDGIYIKGGVVEIDSTTNSNMLLNRNLGTTRNENSPSETIEYDPRYLYIYGDLMTYAYGYNIREGQFIRAQ